MIEAEGRTERRGSRCSTVLLACVVWSCAAPPPEAVDQVRELRGRAFGTALILDPVVIDLVEGRSRAVESIYVKDDAIVAIGAVPVDATQVDLVIDAAGRFVMPGMVDMHVHHTADGAFPTTEASLYDEEDLVLYLAHGVTAVRNMAGRAGDPALAQQAALGAAPRPRFVAAGPPIVTGGRDDAVTSPAAARDAVRSQHAAGFDLIKLYCCFGPEREATLDALLDEAQHLKMSVAGHVPRDLPLERAHRLRSIEHLEHLGDMLDPESLAALAQAHVFVTPTLVPFASHRLVEPKALAAFLESPRAAFVSKVLWDPEVASIEAGQSILQNEQIQADIAAMFESGGAAVRQLADAGVPLLVGTDAGGFFPVVPGFSYPDELELLVEAGLEPLEALRAATVNAARALDVADRRGSIEVGMAADLLLLDADPLADIGHVRTVEGVMVGGWWLDRDTLDAAVASRARR